MTDNSNPALANLLTEERKFPPSQEFAATANYTADIYDDAAHDRLQFWADQARAFLDWHTPFTDVLDWEQAPRARWFADGKLNAAYNALDRHVANGLGERPALLFEGEPGDSEAITYSELLTRVKKAANVLQSLGVGTGDRVAIYMPMIPETIVAMLACARIGAPHSVVFGGFSADALHSRIVDADARVVITADGGYRRGKPGALKPAVDAALNHADNPVEHVVVVQRTKQAIDMVTGRDQWWHELMASASTDHEAIPVEAEHPLYILYTSGTTGRPKGVLHTTGGYLTQCAFTHHAVFDLKPDSDVYWCTADIGWVTGHSYVVYAPLINGATQVIYEGTPDTPHQGRWWEIVEKYGVTILYTAPTAIRTFMKWGEDIPGRYDLSSLKLLGSVGEPINPEAWVWYRRVIGGDKTPVVDTWWQTETGAIMISQLPGITEAKPGACQTPIPGTTAAVWDDMGNDVGPGGGGFLVIADPWPAMLRGVWGNEQRFHDEYWSRYEGIYFAGDGAKYDDEGDIWILGRVDDVMNVSGHRLSTTEIESALVSHEWVAEAAVVGASDDTTGQAVVAFVILRQEALAEAGEGGEEVVAHLRSHVTREIGPIARPRSILVVAELPKTRSGKIMRRLLRDVAENRPVGDVTTLADSSVMDQIQAGLSS